MKRRQLLQAASAGAAGAFAGCTDSFGSLGSGNGDDGVTCDLIPIDDLSRTWSRAVGGPDAARRVTGEFTADTALEAAWTDERGDSAATVQFAAGETLCYSRTDPDEGDQYYFLDTTSGDERWTLDVAPDHQETEFTPPGETVVYDEVRLAPRAIAGGTVYVTATYAGADATISTAVFAVDAGTGSIQWSEAVPGAEVLALDAAGRLFAVGVSDALARADQVDRELSDGEWTPEPGTDRRLHVNVLTAVGGESCWDQEIEIPEDAVAGPRFPVVTGGHVVVSVERGEMDQPESRETELTAFDAATGDETAAVSHTGRPLQEVVLGVGERLVYRTETPPTEDAPTDGPTLCAVALDEGAVDWQIEAPGLVRGATDELVVVESADTITGLDPASGEQEWSTDYDEPITEGDLADATGDNRDGFACIAGDAIVTIGADGSDLQTRALDSGEVRAYTGVVGEIADGRVIAADGQYYAARSVDDETVLVALAETE